MPDEITIVLDRDDAGYCVVALREHLATMRKYADTQSNIRDILLKACERLESVCTRVEKELETNG